MLQYNSPLVNVEKVGSTYDDVPPSAMSSLAERFAAAEGFMRRHFLVVLSAVPLTVGLAVAYLLTTPPLYSAQARLMIDPGKVQLFNQSIFGDDPVNAAKVDSELEILKSEILAASVIKNLHLTQEPEFVGSSRGLIDSAIDLLLHPLASNKPKSEADVAARVQQVFEDRLKVSRLGTTYVIEIEFQSTHPDRAAQIANAIADEFIVDQMETRYQTLGKATTWLQERLIDLQAQASAAERAAVEYQTTHNIVNAGGHLINEQELVELNTAVGKARADKLEAQARLDRISQILREEDFDPTATEVATVTDTLHNEIITKLRQQYLEFKQRAAIFASRLGNDHLAVVNLRNQMREVRRSIFDELKRIAQADRSDYEIAQKRENSLQASLSATVAGSQMTSSAQIELRQLENAAQSYRALYNNFQQHYMDSVQQQSFPVTEARVIARASPPSKNSSPKSFRILAVATMGGLVLGVGLGILREISARVFRTSSQVEAQLKTQCVAIVPMIKPGGEVASVRTKVASLPTEGAADPATSRIISPKVGMLRHVIDTPLSLFAESIRAVKVGIDLSEATKSNKVVGITSSLPNEGKSTIAASLAQLSAHGGARVILVDCDWRKPSSLSAELVPNATLGLIDLVHDKASFDEVIWSDPTSRLSFLPSGVKSGLLHTNEILASDAMRRVFDKLRERYQYVIVDLPPIAPVVDARSTAHFVDTYLFVIEWGKTKTDVVAHALSSARGIYNNLSGVILNKVDLKRLRRYDGYASDYYYHGYTNYGYTG